MKQELADTELDRRMFDAYYGVVNDDGEYVIKPSSLRKVGALFGCSYENVRRRVKRHVQKIEYGRVFTDLPPRIAKRLLRRRFASPKSLMNLTDRQIASLNDIGPKRLAMIREHFPYMGKGENEPLKRKPYKKKPKKVRISDEIRKERSRLMKELWKNGKLYNEKFLKWQETGRMIGRAGKRRKDYYMQVAVGDLHGHFDEWKLLYEDIKKKWNFKPMRDQLIFLGDYVDGGYKSKKLMNWLIEKSEKYPHWKFLLGNHDDMMVKALNATHYTRDFELWYNQGGRATILSYVPKNRINSYIYETTRHATHFIPKEHIDWIKNLPLFYEDERYIFVHAGINPTIWSYAPGMENQEKFDLIWIREPFINSQIDFGKKVIFGHTTFEKPFIKDNKVGIDTMFHNRGKITAMRLEDERFLSRVSRTKTRDDWDKDIDDSIESFMR